MDSDHISTMAIGAGAGQQGPLANGMADGSKPPATFA
jgi:hypothetical protein